MGLILRKGWGWDTRSHSLGACCYVEFPCANALSVERVLVIQGLQSGSLKSNAQLISVLHLCSWVRPGFVLNSLLSPAASHLPHPPSSSACAGSPRAPLKSAESEPQGAPGWGKGEGDWKGGPGMGIFFKKLPRRV